MKHVYIVQTFTLVLCNMAIRKYTTLLLLELGPDKCIVCLTSSQVHRVSLTFVREVES